MSAFISVRHKTVDLRSWGPVSAFYRRTNAKHCEVASYKCKLGDKSGHPEPANQGTCLDLSLLLFICAIMQPRITSGIYLETGSFNSVPIVHTHCTNLGLTQKFRIQPAPLEGSPEVATNLKGLELSDKLS